MIFSCKDRSHAKSSGPLKGAIFERAYRNANVKRFSTTQQQRRLQKHREGHSREVLKKSPREGLTSGAVLSASLLSFQRQRWEVHLVNMFISTSTPSTRPVWWCPCWGLKPQKWIDLAGLKPLHQPPRG